MPTQGTNQGPNALKYVDTLKTQTVESHSHPEKLGTHTAITQTEEPIGGPYSAHSRYQPMTHTAPKQHKLMSQLVERAVPTQCTNQRLTQLQTQRQLFLWP